MRQFVTEMRILTVPQGARGIHDLGQFRYPQIAMVALRHTFGVRRAAHSFAVPL